MIWFIQVHLNHVGFSDSCTGCPNWVGLTLIWIFHHLAHLHSHFCQIPHSLGRIGQTVELRLCIFLPVYRYKPVQLIYRRTGKSPLYRYTFPQRKIIFDMALISQCDVPPPPLPFHFSPKSLVYEKYNLKWCFRHTGWPICSASTKKCANGRTSLLSRLRSRWHSIGARSKVLYWAWQSTPSMHNF